MKCLLPKLNTFDGLVVQLISRKLFSRENEVTEKGTEKVTRPKCTMVKKLLWDGYIEQQFKLIKLLALKLSLLCLCLCFAVQPHKMENICKSTAWNAESKEVTFQTFVVLFLVLLTPMKHRLIHTETWDKRCK